MIYRRQLLLATTGALALPQIKPAQATDIDVITSPLMNLIARMPDRAGSNGLDFPNTSGINERIRSEVPAENPETYWDPLTTDYRNIFGFSADHVFYALAQSEPTHIEIWVVDSRQRWRDATINSLSTHGWTMIDEDLGLMAYGGNDEDRGRLADGLNTLGATITSGAWDYIALIGDWNLVLGEEEAFVRTTADRVKNYTAMTTLKDRFIGLKYLLPVETYDMRMVPVQVLPIVGSDAGFVAKSWLGNEPIVHSVGVELQQREDAPALKDKVTSLLTSTLSPVCHQPYGEFLELVEIEEHLRSLRFDFTVTNGEWDVIEALDTDDLQMFPLDAGNN